MCNPNEIDRIVTTALAEDIGSGDITSELVIDDFAETAMEFVTREDIVVCGLSVLLHIFSKVDSNILCTEHVKDGANITVGTKMLTVSGNARSILSAERVALNILQRMCGISTLTSKFVNEVKGTGVKILDTRKTLPGLREIEKYAVLTGGGENHRMRLDDGILIKDNHLHIAGGVAIAVSRAKKSGMKVEVECDTLMQVKEALEEKADIILLDNMDLNSLKEAVKMSKGRALLEASGGVTFKTIRNIALTGVDYISVGALTHSAPSVDIGLDIK